MSSEPIKDPKTAKFVAGGSSSGRKKGAKNRLHNDFLIALQEHFEQRGKEAIKVAFREDPVQYLKIIASIMPRTFTGDDDLPMVMRIELVDGMAGNAPAEESDEDERPLLEARNDPPRQAQNRSPASLSSASSRKTTALLTRR
jgi:hypothetical protein